MLIEINRVFFWRTDNFPADKSYKVCSAGTLISDGAGGDMRADGAIYRFSKNFGDYVLTISSFADEAEEMEKFLDRVAGDDFEQPEVMGYLDYYYNEEDK